MRILLVEDESRLAAAVEELLKQQKYHVDVVYDGEAGLDFGLTGIYDVIILDIMLPGKDGLAVVGELRKAGIQTPVLLLTARSRLDDRVQGLDAGADDYLTKPFEVPELLARVRAMGRRQSSFVGDILSFGDLKLDKKTGELICGEKRVSLGAKEFQAIELLISNRRQIVTKELFVEKIWGYDCETEYNNVEVYISFLRKKISFLDSRAAIRTVRGRGYLLADGTES